MRSASLIAMLTLAFVAGCSAATTAGSAAAASSGISVNAAPPATSTLLANCPLTRPDPVFVPPSPYLDKPPALYRSSWFGSPALWTMVAPGGDVWHGLSRDKVGYNAKTFWWSRDYVIAHELQPAITVTGRQLGGLASLMGDRATNAEADFGTAMLVGVVFPAPGCWELTARYRSAELSIVVWVAAD